MIKKLSAIVLALAMMLTLSTAMVSAAGETVAVTIENDVYKDDIFEASIVVNGLTTYAGAAVKVEFDPAVLQLVKEDGTSSTKWSEVKASSAPAVMTEMDKIVDNTAGSLEYTVLPNAMHEDWDTSAPYIAGATFPYTVIKIRFKAIAAGDMGLSMTKTDVYATPNEKATATDATDAALTVYSMPVAPTATSPAASTSAPVEAGTVAPTYTWNNGVTDTGAETTTGDASVVTWYAGEDKIGETVAKAEFTVPAKAVGKELSYTILPKVNRELVGEGTLSDKVVVGNVAAIGSYKPEVTAVELDNGAVNADEILASTPVTAVPTTDTTYDENEVKTYTFAYEWYAVDFTADETKTAGDAIAAVAAYTADTETLVKLESTTAEATFDAAEYKDWFAVVKVTPSVTIAGEAEARPGDAFCAAAKVTGEPPVLADDAEAAIAKLEAKKFFTSSTPDATTVKFDSNVVEGAGDTELINYSYAWYLTSELKTADTFDAAEATAIIAEDALKTAGKVKLSKVEGAEGKYLVVVITATDDLGIYSSTTVFFQNAIKKATGGSGTQGGASLVTGTQGGTVVEPDEPAVEPEQDPQDPAGEANDKGASVFTDVDKEVYAWGYDYLDKLAKAGVVKGMTETTYAPEEETTYAQFTALVVRVLGLTAEEAATEKVAADHWSFAEVSVADKLGLLADVAFDADKAITREDMAAIAHKALVAKAVELKAGEAVEYSDASAISEYAAAAIDAMSKAGILNGMGDGTFAPKGTTTRMQTAKVIGMISELIG